MLIFKPIRMLYFESTTLARKYATGAIFVDIPEMNFTPVAYFLAKVVLSKYSILIGLNISKKGVSPTKNFWASPTKNCDTKFERPTKLEFGGVTPKIILGMGVTPGVYAPSTSPALS